MNKCKQVFIRQGLLPIILLVALAWVPLAEAAAVDRSDMNKDGVVNMLDLEIFSATFLQEDWETVDWCVFYESSITNERYFRKLTSDKLARYQRLMDFIAATYDCQATPPTDDKSDLNDDGVVDLADLIIFSTNYLEVNWETVDWCVFHGSVVAGAEYEDQPTDYYLRNFEQLLEFINEDFNCGGVEPPPVGLQIENVPKYLGRVADAAGLTLDYYITDPIVGSLFIYDANLVLRGEITGLSRPLGVAIDLQGQILIGNDGRDNIEVYDRTTGELLAVFGEGLVKMPTAITLDNLGNIYVTDSESHHIRVFDAAYNPINTIGKPGSGKAGLKFPTDSEILADINEIFVADQGHDRVQVYDLNGDWLRSITFDGTEGVNCNWFTGVCDIPGAPPFTRIQALDTDSLGRLHIVDKFAATVIILEPDDGAYVGSYGGYGTDAGLMTVPLDVMISELDMAIVTTGDGDRIEAFSIQ